MSTSHSTEETQIVVADEASPMYARITEHRPGPGDKLFVFAHSLQDADQWAREHGFNRNEYTFVSQYMQLRGVHTSLHSRVFVPGFRKHIQAKAIAQVLAERDAVKVGWRP